MAAVSPPALLPQSERPSIAVLPFDLIGPAAPQAIALQDEITAALCTTRWFSVSEPSKARYHLRGKVRDDGSGRLHVAVILLDTEAGRYLFGPGRVQSANFGFEDESHSVWPVRCVLPYAMPKLIAPGAVIPPSSLPGS